MSPALREYLNLRRLMEELQNHDDGAALAIRETMASLWYQLSTDERDALETTNPESLFKRE